MLPFSVERNRGRFSVRADGLADIFGTPSPYTQGYGRLRGYGRPQDAAIQFARFLRSRLGCSGILQKTGAHDWIFIGRPAVLWV